MWGSAIIVFREVLEAALVVTLVLAATRGIGTRNRWVIAGVLAGMGGAILVALGAETIANLFEGVGQEVMNACILFTAVAMLIWHNIWMAQHGRELSQRLKTVGRQVKDGHEPLYALSIAVGLAVLREGSEVVLFLHGIAADGSSTFNLIAGSALGCAAGVLIGLCLYFGLVRIPVQHFFKVTAWMILLLAAGMAANAVGFLDQAGFISHFTNVMWDTSAWLPDHKNLLGELLHILIGYQAAPTGVQLIAYISTIVMTLLLTQWVAQKTLAVTRSHAK